MSKLQTSKYLNFIQTTKWGSFRVVWCWSTRNNKIQASNIWTSSRQQNGVHLVLCGACQPTTKTKINKLPPQKTHNGAEIATYNTRLHDTLNWRVQRTRQKKKKERKRHTRHIPGTVHNNDLTYHYHTLLVSTSSRYSTNSNDLLNRAELGWL